MKELCLSPLPSHRAADPSSVLLLEREGFVDEAVVTALVTANQLGRSVSYPEDLALAADDLDFAGWSLPKTIHTRSAEVPPEVIDAIVRRTPLPVTGGQQGGSRLSGKRRGWLSAMAQLLGSCFQATLECISKPFFP